MMFRPLRYPFVVLLVVLIGWTGFVAAYAHGQTRASGDVLVLCAQDGPVQIVLGPDGKPAKTPRICPDLALGLISALDVSPPEIVRPVKCGAGDLIFTAFEQEYSSRRSDRPARGPPAVV